MTGHRRSEPIVVRHSSKGGKTYSIIVKGERSVDVLHEAVAEDPDVVTETEVLAHDRSGAHTVTITNETLEVEAEKRTS